MVTEAEAEKNLLLRVLSYDAETGGITWQKRPRSDFDRLLDWTRWQEEIAGTEAIGWINNHGYRHIKVNGKTYKWHRVAWLLHWGYWPSEQIDHINGNKTDNRIVNLRDVSPGENNLNQKLQSNNKSGRVGVMWLPRDNVWVAQIKVRGQRHHLGSFKTFEEACEARLDAERRFGFHPNHGRAA